VIGLVASVWGDAEPPNLQIALGENIIIFAPNMHANIIKIGISSPT
jgi:hypothetical protein